MKKVEAIIRPEKVNTVIFALEKAGYAGVTVYEVAGHGRQRGSVGREISGEVQLRPKVMLMVVVNDQDLDKILKAIIETANTNKIGDGKIFVTDLKEVIRIRTAEHGQQAIG